MQTRTLLLEIVPAASLSCQPSEGPQPLWALWHLGFTWKTAGLLTTVMQNLFRFFAIKTVYRRIDSDIFSLGNATRRFAIEAKTEEETTTPIGP